MPVVPAAMPPFRAEVIGSLLRSRRLKEAGRAKEAACRWPTTTQPLQHEVARVIARQDIGLAW